ncbi:metal-dependent hydrolase [Capsulimonas corticalis]|uniref:Metal-dependent hydrolase n=1 Tax=Capsulimonas corticalis TaxID=2219043 RepID=A0A402D2Q7_9BACT|nr:metal-dependent hydrolase [Capsulimonas corticalis]BDI28439.1 metal-dependent hydrolase [Capsulimonas corticalis]
MTIDLRERWRAFCASLNLDARLTDEYYTLIAANMSEEHRAYHNLAHVQALLRDFESVAHLVQDRASFEWKIWLHDLIYRPGAPDNERESAEVARRWAREAGLDEAFGADVYEGIMATKTHLGTTEDDRLLVTLDLAILAASEEEFDRYERQVASEFLSNPEISWEAYRAGRLAWAEAFNQRVPIYPAHYGQENFEAAAHKNLVRSMIRLEQGIVIKL